MNRTRTGYLLVLLSLMNASRSQAQQAGGAAEKTVAALEQTWLQSQKTSNPDLLAPLLADKFVNTGSDGKVTAKAETLALVKMMKFDAAEYYDVKVTIFGDTAIATGGFRGNGTDASGKPLTVNERWTDTWVKMPSGQWQCVASHASPITTQLFTEYRGLSQAVIAARDSFSSFTNRTTVARETRYRFAA